MDTAPSATDDQLAELQAFVDRHGHLPSPIAPDLSCLACPSDAGRAIGRWFKAVIDCNPQVKVSHDTAVAVYRLADTVPPARLYGGLTEGRLQELERFVEKTGRMPRKSGRGTTVFLNERALNLWYRSVLHGKMRVSDDVAEAVRRLADEHGRGLPKPARTPDPRSAKV